MRFGSRLMSVGGCKAGCSWGEAWLSHRGTPRGCLSSLGSLDGPTTPQNGFLQHVALGFQPAVPRPGASGCPPRMPTGTVHGVTSLTVRSPSVGSLRMSPVHWTSGIAWGKLSHWGSPMTPQSPRRPVSPPCTVGADETSACVRALPAAPPP